MLGFILNNATRVIANSEYVREPLEPCTSRRIVPVVYDGFDETMYSHDGREKEDLLITIGPIQRLDVKRKGIEVFAKTAARFPNTKFVVIGSFLDDSIEHLRSMAPPNVEFTGYVDNGTKIEYMRRAKVYAQLSSLEGCPWAISEAMLCECVPIATEGGGTAEVVGDTGYYAQYGDVETTVNALALALDDHKNSRAARSRIIQEFSIREREKRLSMEIERLASRIG